MEAKRPDLTRLRAWLEYPWASGPTVSADGRWVHFRSNRGGLPQAWSMPLEGGTPVCLHSSRENVGQVLASPSGSEVLLSIDRGGDEHWQLYVREGDPNDPTRPVRALTQDPTRIHEPGAWCDGHRFVFGSNRRDVRFFDVYELNLTGTAGPRVVHQEDAWVRAVAADRNRVLLARANTNLDADLFLVDAGHETLLTPHDGELTVWSADFARKDVIAAANPERELAALVRYHAGAAPEVLKAFDGDVELVKCEPGGSGVAFAVNRQGSSELHLYDTESGEDRVVTTPGLGVVASVSWIPNGAGLVVEYASSTTGQELWRYRPNGPGLERLTRSTVAMPGPTVAPTLHHFRAEDGLEVPYWEYVPSSGGVRGTIVWVHGGPESQSRPAFFARIAFLVSEGWRIVAPNVRGSTGYGRTYVHLDDVRKRMDSVRDLRDLVRALSAEGTVRAGRVGLVGGSYGGFMVLAALTSYPELWGAAAEYFGISNFVTFLEHTGPWRRKIRED